MSRRLKLLLGLVGGLIALVALALGFVYLASERVLAETFEALPDRAPTIPTDAEALERGEHLAHAISKCADCHGEDHAGGAMFEDPAMGQLHAPNITRGEGGLEDPDALYWTHAIRHGVGADGTGFVLHPSRDYLVMSDADLGAMIAYLDDLPTVDNQVPERRLGPLARILLIADQLPLDARNLDHDIEQEPPEPAVSVEYGAYLADIAGCTGCHGADLAGGPIAGAPPDAPQAANLTRHAEGLGDWNLPDFKRLLRDGRRPDGSQVDDFMPWQATSKMTDNEISALWLHLRQVEPVASDG